LIPIGFTAKDLVLVAGIVCIFIGFSSNLDNIEKMISKMPIMYHKT
jgi:hypothetical protein